ncbi:hypothetical protein [Deinococcus altitudinis]|uniref:hypothetical protein n=1 Tax=Deinococcus altitudinis TaxID=468914 RepID=UPI003891BF6C
MNTRTTNIGIAAAALILSACAPTLSETPVTLTRTYPTSCTAALKAVQVASARISPDDSWLAYETVSATADRVVLQASSRPPATRRTSSVWTCNQTINAFTANSAVISVTTTGLNSDLAQSVHRAFFGALTGL